MDFNYEEENKKLILANENIDKVISKYNEILLNLSDREKIMMQLHYYFKKLDTLNKMTPKGNYWNDRRDKYINIGLDKIKNLGNIIFTDITDLVEIRNNVDSYMKNSNLLIIINNFSLDIKATYKKYSSYVYTVLPISGIKELKASKH